MSSNPPPDSVRQAAAIVQQYLDGEPPQRATDAEFAKMNAAERLDYTRRFPQILDHGRKK